MTKDIKQLLKSDKDLRLCDIDDSILPKFDEYLQSWQDQADKNHDGELWKAVALIRRDVARSMNAAGES